MATVVFIPRETEPGEQRVAATPESVRQLTKSGLEVRVQSGAGERAFISDSDFEAAGARIAASPDGANVILRVSPPAPADVAAMSSGALLISFLAPARNLPLVRALAERNITALAMELVPRTTKAQPMDALSSQASIAGYKAVLLAAWKLGRYFPLLMTAAGTIKPARVVIMGAGVAGLQAVATAKRLGAIVEVSDIREAVKEQVESLGGKFIALPMQQSGEGTGGYAREMGEDFLRQQREIVARHVAAADVVITTAQIPGKRAPLLLTREMVEGMRPGSIVIDLAVDSGGNCELSKPEGEQVHRGVTILGASSLPAETPQDASTLYARNVQALLLHLVKEGTVNLDFEDEIVAGTTLTHAGTVRHAPTAELLKGES
ncbi:MAG TPA: Re/Si-specific NAD(P)(+) transhydrogenase subunit alpha [Thermoanaerobaculia bacterium]|nr:Re/Si-specific NAD(P)(+) transhydrogenase subunit alpha [Thermoanaerobaculia bacterium]